MTFYSKIKTIVLEYKNKHARAVTKKRIQAVKAGTKPVNIQTSNNPEKRTTRYNDRFAKEFLKPKGGTGEPGDFSPKQQKVVHNIQHKDYKIMAKKLYKHLGYASDRVKQYAKLSGHHFRGNNPPKQRYERNKSVYDLMRNVYSKGK